jgi:hypothetical protein
MGEVRKIALEDVQWGATTDTWTSAGGVSVHYVPYPYAGAGTSATDNALIIDPRAYGASLDGATDASDEWQDAIDAAGANGGGVIDGGGYTYILNDAGLTVNYDNVFIRNATFQRTNGTTGWLITFASTTNTTGGGLIHVKVVGVPTNVSGNGGVLMGSGSFTADEWTMDDVIADSFSQYGVGIGNGDAWKAYNIRVLNHGLTSGTITTCIGFYVYPTVASTGGQLYNVYSEISSGSINNANANHAAVKLQTHQNFIASNITAVYGSEEAMTIDSVEGIVRNVYVLQQGTNAGLAVGNYNTSHTFSGQKFILDGFYIDGGININGFVIGGGTDGQYQLDGCVIRNGYGIGATYLALTNARNCTFDTLDFEDIRFDAAYNSYTVNSLASVNNTYRNITVRGGGLAGVLVLESTDGVISNCGTNAVSGDTVGTFQVTGDDNTIVSSYARDVTGNAFTIVGDSNDIFNLSVGPQVTGRSIWFKSGSDNNRVYSGSGLWNGTGILDAGSGNYYTGAKVVQYGTVAPTSGTWATGDVVWNTAGGAGSVAFWRCVTAGTPGTWESVVTS